MDAIVRCIREGRPTQADAAPLVLVLDDLSIVGGRAVFHTVSTGIWGVHLQCSAECLSGWLVLRRQRSTAHLCTH